MPGPMGGPRGRQTVERAKDFKGTVKKLIKNYIAKYKIAMVVVILFAVAGTIFEIIGPRVLGDATTEVFNGFVSKLSGGTGIDFGKIGQILMTLFILYVLSCIFSFIQGFTMTGVAQKLTYQMGKFYLLLLMMLIH